VLLQENCTMLRLYAAAYTNDVVVECMTMFNCLSVEDSLLIEKKM